MFNPVMYKYNIQIFYYFKFIYFYVKLTGLSNCAFIEKIGSLRV